MLRRASVRPTPVTSPAPVHSEQRRRAELETMPKNVDNNSLWNIIGTTANRFLRPRLGSLFRSQLRPENDTETQNIEW